MLSNNPQMRFYIFTLWYVINILPRRWLSLSVVHNSLLPTVNSYHYQNSVLHVEVTFNSVNH